MNDEARSRTDAAECTRFDAHIAALGTDALGTDDERRLRAHLAACDRCAELSRLFDGGSAGTEDLGASGADGAPGDAALAPGVVIAGRYRLERLLGRGGMGVVWAATQEPTGQGVAVKLIHRAGADERARRRFLREARAACAVRHPNVVRVLDVVEDEGGAPALVMELLDGEPLQRRFERGAVPTGELCDILLRVARAVGAAHRAGIVHRDLKPDNVFLARGADGAVEVKVLDFGIAKRTTLERGGESGTLTRSLALLGTPYYMSPEQALGEDDVDARADLWALGIMLYQGLTGVLPTRADNLGRVIKAVAITPITPVERLAPALPADLAVLVGRMLEKPREARPRDMDEVCAVLARHATPEGHAPTAPAPPARHRAPILLVGLGAALAMGAAAIAVTRAPSRGAAPTPALETIAVTASTSTPVPPASPAPAEVASALPPATALPSSAPPDAKRRAAPSAAAVPPSSQAGRTPPPSPSATSIPAPGAGATGKPPGIGVENGF